MRANTQNPGSKHHDQREANAVRWRAIRQATIRLPKDRAAAAESNECIAIWYRR